MFDNTVLQPTNIIIRERRNTHFLPTTGRSNFYTNLAIHSTFQQTHATFLMHVILINSAAISTTPGDLYLLGCPLGIYHH